MYSSNNSCDRISRGPSPVNKGLPHGYQMGSGLCLEMGVGRLPRRGCVRMRAAGSLPSSAQASRSRQRRAEGCVQDRHYGPDKLFFFGFREREQRKDECRGWLVRLSGRRV
jgi:hypothetical protein